MKKVFTCTGGLLLSFLLISTAYAGAIDNKTNWSAEYIRTLNRNAATDYADIAAYNPAGTVKLHEGLTINGSVQYLNKKYTNNVTHSLLGGTAEYESEEPSYVPGLFAVYNKDWWSLFGSVTVVAGGGKVDFSDGDYRLFKTAALVVLGGAPLCPFDPLDPFTFDPSKECDAFDPATQKLTAESYYLGYTLGTAFKVNEMFSLSMGLRYVNAHKELKASVTLYDGMTDYPTTAKFEQDGSGWGGIFGVNIAPNDKLNIGMRYETKTDINLESSVPFGPGTIILFNETPPIIDDVLNPRDLPAIFAAGISYWVTPKLRIETNYTHYFNKDADWAGEEDKVDDGFDLGVALEYHFNDSLLASIGYLYTVLGVDPGDMLPENPELDANSVGAGIAYAISENLHTNISIGNSFYTDDSFTPQTLGGKVEYEKNVFYLAMGLEYRF